MLDWVCIFYCLIQCYCCILIPLIVLLLPYFQHNIVASKLHNKSLQDCQNDVIVLGSLLFCCVCFTGLLMNHWLPLKFLMTCYRLFKISFWISEYAVWWSHCNTQQKVQWGKLMTFTRQWLSMPSLSGFQIFENKKLLL